MNTHFAAFVMSVLISVGAVADSPNRHKYSDSELWDVADLVALVRIRSGTYTEDVGFDIEATPITVLKGKSATFLKISAHYPLLDVPSELGSSYLVFLAETGPEQYVLIQEFRSAVRIIYVEIDDDMGIRMNALGKSDRPPDWYSYDGSLWVVDCKQPITFTRRHRCPLEKSIVQYAMNEVGGVKGQ